MQGHDRITREVAPLRQQVLKLLREDILNGMLPPGMRLREGQLCERYGVSRTVIREALRQLETENLITMVPSHGPIVTVLTVEEIRSLYAVRGTLEGMMGKLFAQNASPEDVQRFLEHRDCMSAEYTTGSIAQREEYKAKFYRLLLAGGGNAELASLLRGIHARIAIFRRFAFEDETRMKISVEELNLIYDAAGVRRDLEAAWNACEAHIVHAGELAIEEYGRRAYTAS